MSADKISYRNIIFWLTASLLFGAFVYSVKGILLPFVIGTIAAYFLDPLADRLERDGLRRSIATALITAAFFSVIILLAALILPQLVEQGAALVSALPEYISAAREKLNPYIEKVTAVLKTNGLADTANNLEAVQGGVAETGTKIATGLWQSGLGLLNVISLLIITPVVTFYMLKDWDRIVAKFDSLLPRARAEEIREQFRLIDKSIAGFIRGQTNVCLIMALFFGVSLTACGLKYGFLIGITTGLLMFIPYVGFFTGFVIGTLIAVTQFDETWRIALIAGVFMTGQIIESSFITPKIVGERVGLHPLWIIFGILVGGTLLGFIGILLAVPITASAAVLLRYAIGKYKASAIYG